MAGKEKTEPVQMTPKEVTTDPELAQLLDTFSEEDIKKLSKVLKLCGGDATRFVEAIFSVQPPNVPKEPEQMTPNEVTTDPNPKLAQLLDMFPEEDIEKLSKLLKVCGGDATLTVEAILSGQAANVPQEPEQMTPNEVTTEPKLTQLLDMFPEEDGESHSKRRKICGGDVPLATVLSAQVPGVPQVRKFDCKDFFEKYKDKFLGSVNTHEIAQLLEIKKVIPESLFFELKRTSNDAATEMLYGHMRDYGSLETVCSLCDVMIGKEGYPKMNSLGRDIKEDLPILKQREDHPVNIVSIALHAAASSGDISEFENLVQKYRSMPGFDVDCLIKGRTPLHTAALRGHVDIVEKLAKLGCDMSKTDDSGSTALHYAAEKGHVDVVTKLVELGCDMNKTDNKRLTALHIAAFYGHVDVIAKLVELGCDMYKTNNNRLTALHYAAEKGHVDVVAKLVELGCDMNRTDILGFTVLHYAAAKYHVDVVAKLVELKCDMNKTINHNEWTALHIAAERGRVDVVAKLVELGCDVNERDLMRRTALHTAASEGHVKVVTKLIELGCDMNMTGSLGATALHLAALFGHADVVAVLVHHGTDINRTDTDGMAALHFAAQRGHVNVVTKLLELGCDRNKTNDKGQTALDIAKAEGHIDIVAKLIR